MSEESDKLRKDEKLTERTPSSHTEENVQSSSNPKSEEGNHPQTEASSESKFDKNETSIENKVGDTENEFDCKKCGEGFQDILGVIGHDCPQKETEPESPLQMMESFKQARTRKLSEVEGEKNATVNDLVSLTSTGSTPTRQTSRSGSPGNSKQEELEVFISSQNLHDEKCNSPTEPEIVYVKSVSHSTPKKSSPSKKKGFNISPRVSSKQHRLEKPLKSVFIETRNPKEKTWKRNTKSLTGSKMKRSSSCKTSTEYFSNVSINPDVLSATHSQQNINDEFLKVAKAVNPSQSPVCSYVAFQKSKYECVGTSTLKWPKYAKRQQSSPSSNVHRYYRSRSMSPTALNLSYPPPSYNARRGASLSPQSLNIDFSTSPREVNFLQAPGGSYLAHKNSNYGYIETPFKWTTYATPPRSSSNIHRYYRSRSMSPTALNLSQPPPSYNATKKWSSTSKLTTDVYTKSPKYSTPKRPSQSFQTCIDNSSKGLMNLGSVNLVQSLQRYNTGTTKQSPQMEVSSMSPSLTSPLHQSHVLEHLTKDPSRSFSPSELGYSLQSSRKLSSSVETISPSRMEIDRYSTFVTPEKTFKPPKTSADDSWSRFRSPAALHSSISSQSSDSSGEKISPHTKWKKQWEERYTSSAEYKLASPSDKVLTNDSSVGFDNLGVLNLSQSSQGSRDLTDNLIEEPDLERSNFNFVTPKRLSPPSKASTSDSSGSFVSPEAVQVSESPRLKFSAKKRSPQTKRESDSCDDKLTFAKGKKSSPNPPKDN